MADDNGKRIGEGFYIGDNDFEFFQSVNQEFIEEIVEVPVGYFRVCPSKTEVNIYGESKEGRKLYEKPVKLYAIINPEDQQTDQGEFTFDVDRDVTFGFQRERLKDFDLYPQRGDLIEFDNDYYEIDDVVDNQLLGSQWFYRHSVVANTHVARPTSISLVDPETLDVVDTINEVDNSFPNKDDES